MKLDLPVLTSWYNEYFPFFLSPVLQDVWKFHICCWNTNIADTVCITTNVICHAFTASVYQMMVSWVSTLCRTVFSFFHFRGMTAFIFRVVSYIQIDCPSLCQPGHNSSPWRLRQHIWNVIYQLVTPHGVKIQMSYLILYSLSLLRKKKCLDWCQYLGSRNTYLICWPINKIQLSITVIVLHVYSYFCTFYFPNFTCLWQVSMFVVAWLLSSEAWLCHLAAFLSTIFINNRDDITDVKL